MNIIINYKKINKNNLALRLIYKKLPVAYKTVTEQTQNTCLLRTVR